MLQVAPLKLNDQIFNKFFCFRLNIIKYVLNVDFSITRNRRFGSAWSRTPQNCIDFTLYGLRNLEYCEHRSKRILCGHREPIAVNL